MNWGIFLIYTFHVWYNITKNSHRSEEKVELLPKPNIYLKIRLHLYHVYFPFGYIFILLAKILVG